MKNKFLIIIVSLVSMSAFADIDPATGPRITCEFYKMNKNRQIQADSKQVLSAWFSKATGVSKDLNLARASLLLEPVLDGKNYRVEIYSYEQINGNTVQHSHRNVHSKVTSTDGTTFESGSAPRFFNGNEGFGGNCIENP